jgi:hypothetical protein
MAHPLKHAESSARKFGGKASDYLAIHNWFDASKAHASDLRHRAALHHSFGIFLSPTYMQVLALVWIFAKVAQTDPAIGAEPDCVILDG